MAGSSFGEVFRMNVAVVVFARNLRCTKELSANGLFYVQVASAHMSHTPWPELECVLDGRARVHFQRNVDVHSKLAENRLRVKSFRRCFRQALSSASPVANAGNPGWVWDRWLSLKIIAEIRTPGVDRASIFDPARSLS